MPLITSLILVDRAEPGQFAERGPALFSSIEVTYLAARASVRALLPRGSTGFIPVDRVPLAELNLRFVLLWILILEKQQGVDVIHSVAHDPGHFRIGDSGVAGFAGTSGAERPRVERLNRSVAEG
jgi:hypothetical protein